jgi:uncharacterized membrane protein YhaH (DUF805 family)
MRELQSMMVFMPFIGLIVVALVLIPYWMIWKKAGFSPWLSLLMLLPLVGFVMLYVLAFVEWKVVPVNRATYPGQTLPPPAI